MNKEEKNNNKTPLEEMNEMYEETKRIEKKSKKYTLLLLTMIILLLATSTATTFSFLLYRDKSGKNLNIDINNDGWPELNVSLNGTQLCQTNCDTGNEKTLLYKSDGKPDYNITYGYLGTAYFDIDTNGDKKGDTNLSNRDIDNDGICDLNCDVDNDGWPDTNIDLKGTGIPTLNIDTNNDGICDINCDINKDGIIDYNMDFDGDGIADMLILGNGEKTPTKNLVDQYSESGKCLLNCDLNKDGWPDTNIDLDGDGKIDIETIFNIKEYQNTTNNTISLTSQEEYIINYIDESEVNTYITPSWTGKKDFTIKNQTSDTITYSIKWIDVTNTYTEKNNLYFGLRRNYNLVLDINENRLPYTDKYLIENVEIKPNQTHEYDLSFLFKETNENQDIDKGKIFYAKLKIEAQ